MVSAKWDCITGDAIRVMRVVGNCHLQSTEHSYPLSCLSLQEPLVEERDQDYYSQWADGKLRLREAVGKPGPKM